MASCSSISHRHQQEMENIDKPASSPTFKECESFFINAEVGTHCRPLRETGSCIAAQLLNPNPPKGGADGW